MSASTTSNVHPLPVRARQPVLLAPDVRGSFARELSVARPVSRGSGSSIEDAILSLLESDREHEDRLSLAEAA